MLSIKKAINFGPKPFKYQSYWRKHDKFSDLLQNVWNETPHGNPMKSLCQKLKFLKGLKKLNRENFSNITNRVVLKKDQLSIVQTILQQLPFDDELIQQDRLLTPEYAELLSAEEEFYKAKSRVAWLQSGDRNTSFFHRKVSSDIARNRIVRQKNEDDEIITEYNAVKEMAVDFYKQLFTQHGITIPIGRIEQIVPCCITDEQRDILAAGVSTVEIKAALFEMKEGNAPGPDRYTVDFF
ncbi:hypothetical protein ACH5RR_003093 [Cinchona calisaya]|uniref:Uncharacterized protein n=1 Tax=Cinchona calisaya TaxID=153742 RepID=A0ABD3ATU4_9GENT